MSLHSFDPAIAARVGVNAAVIYQNIKFWCEKNEANKKHFHDGRTWTYNSVSAFSKLFPYFSPKQIRTALQVLCDNGLIGVGCYNDNPNDRTNWYCDLHLGQMDLPCRANGLAPEGKCITDSKPDIKHSLSLSAREGFDEFWKMYPNKVGKGAAEKAFSKAIKKVSFDRLMQGLHKYANKTDDRPWCNPSTWLNQERWADEKPLAISNNGANVRSKGLTVAQAAIASIRNGGDNVSIENELREYGIGLPAGYERTDQNRIGYDDFIAIETNG